MAHAVPCRNIGSVRPQASVAAGRAAFLGGGVSLGPRDIEDPMLALRTRMLFVVTTVREFLCSELGPA